MAAVSRSPRLSAEDRAAVEAAHAKVSDAIAACYKLNTPQPHTITLEPSDGKQSKFATIVDNDLNQAYLTVTQTPVKVNWNTSEFIDHTTTVTITNPNTNAKTGTLHWNSGAGWNITPAMCPSPSSRARALPSPSPLPPSPAPRCSRCRPWCVRWKWTKDWAYLQSVNRELALSPVLTVKHAAAPPTIDGDLHDWTDATSFTLDDIHYFDPPVAGKKALWGGPADLSVKMMMQWDEQALYLGALVRDSEHIQNAEPGMMWSQDMLHVAAFIQQPDTRMAAMSSVSARMPIRMPS